MVTLKLVFSLELMLQGVSPSPVVLAGIRDATLGLSMSIGPATAIPHLAD